MDHGSILVLADKAGRLHGELPRTFRKRAFFFLLRALLNGEAPRLRIAVAGKTTEPRPLWADPESMVYIRYHEWVGTKRVRVGMRVNDICAMSHRAEALLEDIERECVDWYRFPPDERRPPPPQHKLPSTEEARQMRRYLDIMQFGKEEDDTPTEPDAGLARTLARR